MDFILGSFTQSPFVNLLNILYCPKSYEIKYTFTRHHKEATVKILEQSNKYTLFEKFVKLTAQTNILNTFGFHDRPFCAVIVHEFIKYPMLSRKL